MQERVTHLGGTFHVTSEPGSGTLITIMLPLAGDAVPHKELTT